MKTVFNQSFGLVNNGFIVNSAIGFYLPQLAGVHLQIEKSEKCSLFCENGNIYRFYFATD
jgi:hypothetical protein